MTAPQQFFILILLTCLALFMLGCGAKCVDRTHSCPEPGHGPCYICDKKIIYGKDHILFK